MVPGLVVSRWAPWGIWGMKGDSVTQASAEGEIQVNKMPDATDQSDASDGKHTGWLIGSPGT